jgi:UDP-arabinose 4-epimerase
MHFAAFAYVGESVADPNLYYRNNVAGSISLLEAMSRAGVNQIVFSSSCATYGVPERVPICEDTPQRPINPYGMSKLMVERVLADAGAAYGLRWVALRYFNAAGADPDGDVGENHDPETHAVPLAIEAALGKRPAFHLLGDNYPTPDGSAVRDYVHVSDLADAHVAALRHLVAGGASTALNLGVGRGVSVLELCAAIERVTGRAVPLRRAPRRPGDPPILVAAADKAERMLGWSARFREMDDIVRHAAAWIGR